MLSWIYKDLFFNGEDFRGYGIYITYLFYFITEKFDADSKGFIRRIQFNHIAADSKCPPLEVDIISGVLDVGQSAEQVVSAQMVAGANGHYAGLIILR